MDTTPIPAQAPREVFLREDDYVLWSNAINQGIYTLPLNARRVLYAALTTIRPSNPELRTVIMPVGEVVRAFGLDDSRKSYDALRVACEQLMNSSIKAVDAEGNFRLRHWVDTAETTDNRQMLKLKISREVHDIVLGGLLQQGFSVLMLYDLARLSGDYAQRIYADVMEASVHEGKHGNGASSWWIDLMFDDLRVRYNIGQTKYSGRDGTKNFRRKVLDEPIMQINEADMGIRIVPDYEQHRYRQRLIGVRLNVSRVKRDEPRNVTPVTKTEIDDERMIAENPKAYAECLAIAIAEMRQTTFFSDMERTGYSADEIARGTAIDKLTAWLKDGKKPKG